MSSPAKILHLKLAPSFRGPPHSPDGKTLAIGSNTLRLIDPISGNRIQEFGKLDGQATSLAFSPSGEDLLAVDAACPGTTVRLIEIESGDETILGEKIRYERVGATFSPDGKIVVVNDGFSQAVLWRASTGKQLKAIAGFHRDANSLVFTPNGERLLSGRNDSYINDLLIWDAAEILQPTSTSAK